MGCNAILRKGMYYNFINDKYFIAQANLIKDEYFDHFLQYILYILLLDYCLSTYIIYANYFSKGI